MKFTIARASGKPVDEATFESLTHLDWRIISTLDEVKLHPWGKDWFAQGKNHREEKGMIVRELPSSEFTVELNSLEDLLGLLEKANDPLIVQGTRHIETGGDILIYDEYIE